MNLIKNIYFRISSNVIIAFMGVITSFFVVRSFGAEVIGIIAFYMSIIGVMTCVCDLGLSNTYIKFIADDKYDEKDVMATYFFLKLLLMITYIVSCLMYVYLINEGMDQKLILIFFTSFLLANGIQSPLLDICRARREFKIISIVEVTSNIIIFIYTIIICLYFQSMYLIALKYLLLYSLQISLLLVYLARCKSLHIRLPNNHLVKSFFRYARPLALSAFITKIMANADKLILGNLIGMKELGFYDIAKRLFSPVDMLIKPVTTTLFPEVLKRMQTSQTFFDNEFREITQTLTCVASIISICLIFFSKPVVEFLYGIENIRAAIILSFFSGICITKLFFRPYHQLIYGLELQKIYPYIALSSSFIKLLGYMMLIPLKFESFYVGAIGIPITNAFNWIFPGGFIIWTKIHQKYNKTHMFETILKIIIPLLFVLYNANQFNFNLYFFPFALIIFIIVQIQLNIITKYKINKILNPLSKLYK